MKRSSQALGFVVLAVLVLSPLRSSYGAPIPDPGNPDSVIIDLAHVTRYSDAQDKDTMLVVPIIVNFDQVASYEVTVVAVPVSFRSPNDYWDLDTNRSDFYGSRWVNAPIKSIALWSKVADTNIVLIVGQEIFNPLPAGRDTMALLTFVKNPAVDADTGYFKFGFTLAGATDLSMTTTIGQQWIPVGLVTDPTTSNYGPWPDSIRTDVVDITGDGPVPEQYTLSQNYPNPFNAQTLIEFTLSQPGQVKLEIYNILGQKVATPVDEYLTAGRKRTIWDGTDANGTPVASGMYFYRLTTADFVGMKKMVLMK